MSKKESVYSNPRHCHLLYMYFCIIDDVVIVELKGLEKGDGR